MFWYITHTDLDSKIGNLEAEILSSERRFVGEHDWDSTFNLIEEIFKDFKKIRYPSKPEREEAWQKFSNLWNDARRIKQKQYEEKSQSHYNEISGFLNDAYHTEFGDSIVSMMTGGLMSPIDIDGMKWKEQQLKEAGRLFQQYKHEMTREHKSDIHERIMAIRESHNIWWGQYKEYREEQQRAWQDRQAARQERQQAARERVEQNLQKNKGNLSSAKQKLEKAEHALEWYKQKRSDLQDKIDESSSENWLEKADGYMQEFEDKISDIESSISDKEDYIARLQSWIDEDEETLRNWN